MAGKQDKPRFWWSYAPLIAFAINLWPHAPFILAVLEGKYVRFYAGSIVFSLLLFAADNLAFVVLFFVARQKITEAIEQRLPLGSVKAAMWSSLIIMFIVPNNLTILLIYVPPYGRESHLEGRLFLWMFGLYLQVVVLPLLGWIGWFAGREFYRVRSKLTDPAIRH